MFSPALRNTHRPFVGKGHGYWLMVDVSIDCPDRTANHLPGVPKRAPCRHDLGRRNLSSLVCLHETADPVVGRIQTHLLVIIFGVFGRSRSGRAELTILRMLLTSYLTLCSLNQSANESLLGNSLEVIVPSKKPSCGHAYYRSTHRQYPIHPPVSLLIPRRKLGETTCPSILCSSSLKINSYGHRSIVGGRQ